MAWAKQVICRGASREGHRGPQGPRYFRPGGGLSRRTLRRGTAENRPCPGPGTRSAAPPFGRAFFQPGPEFKRGYSSADSRNDPCMEHSGYLRNPRLRRSIFNVRPDRSPFGRPACPDRPPREVFQDPVSLEAARFMGPVNHIPAALGRELRPRIEVDPRYGVPGLRPRRAGKDLFLRPEALEFFPSPDGDATLVMSCFLGHRVLQVVEWRGKRWEAAGSSPELPPGTRGKLIFHIEEE